MAWTFAGQYGPEAIIDAAGNVRVGASCLVKQGVTPATLYTDRTKSTTTANPVATDSNGNLTFFADPGNYTVEITYLAVLVLTITVIVPVDPFERPRLDTINDFTEDQRFSSGRPWFDVMAAAFGATGDGVTDDTDAIQACIDEADDFAATNGGRALVYFPAGEFLTDGIDVHARVSLKGAGREVSKIVNRDTNGNNFVRVYGSQVTIEDLTIDGKRASQAVATGGALVVAKPNGAGSLAGGLTLASSVSIGATSFSVTSATFGGEPILPGDVVTFLEGVQLEMVRVKRSYTGGTTVTVDRPFTKAWTTAAKVTVAATNVTVRNCLVLGCGFAGITVWHGIDCLVADNYVRDCFDICIDLPDAGSRHVTIRGNQIESDCRFGIAMDTVATEFGRTQHCSILGNNIRLLNGSDTRYAIWLGDVNDVLVEGNICDLLKAGTVGIRVDQDAHHIAINGNHIYGVQTASTFGIEVVEIAGTDADRRLTVNGNIIRDFDIGINLRNCRTAVCTGNKILSSLNYGINSQAHATLTMDICCTGNLIDTCVAGIRAGGTPVTGSKMRARENAILNFSFDDVTSDSGWLLYQDQNDTTLADTSGASLAALETEVNTLKARLRTFGVLRP